MTLIYQRSIMKTIIFVRYSQERFFDLLQIFVHVFALFLSWYQEKLVDRLVQRPAVNIRTLLMSGLLAKQICERFSLSFVAPYSPIILLFPIKSIVFLPTRYVAKNSYQSRCHQKPEIHPLSDAPRFLYSPKPVEVGLHRPISIGSPCHD